MSYGTVPTLEYHVRIITKSNLGKAPYASFVSLAAAKQYAQQLSRPYDDTATDKGDFGLAAVVMDATPTTPLYLFRDGAVIMDHPSEQAAVAVLSRHLAEADGYAVYQSKGGKWNPTPAGRWHFVTPCGTVSTDDYPDEATAWVAAARDFS
jgi:hypothetical protein